MHIVRIATAVFGLAALAGAADPVRTAWILSVQSHGSAILPDVHAVEFSETAAIVRSSGISLRYFGPLQSPPLPGETVREFEFRIPLHPAPETGRHTRVPTGVIGTFLNGLPIYNQFETLSYNGANLWHYDAVAANDDGTLTAAGHPRAELTHPAAAGLLEQLIPASARHSPLIGFALDGYPIYGPWGYANVDGTGGLRRMGSSYRLRSISRRQSWPDSTALTPEQYGPDVSAADPLGSFAEDYEYAPKRGDLDEFNGRFTVTPEYPQGTYAYFLTTDDAGRLAFPYLIGSRYYGHLPGDVEQNEVAHGVPTGRLRAVTKHVSTRWLPVERGPGPSVGISADAARTSAPATSSARLTLSASEAPLQAGRPVRFRLLAEDRCGEPIRSFEYVHERPIHLLIASADLAEFDHIHPEVAADDSYLVDYTFAHGGRYRIWADYSLPGEAPHADRFDVTVEGPERARRKLAPSPQPTEKAGSLAVTLTPAKPLRAGEDIPITLSLSGETATLEPYLGAWAHVIVVSEDIESFAHAHPIDAAPVMNAVHTHVAAGPPPGEVRIVTNFPHAGLYKLWAQFQQQGTVLTVPFVLRVDAAVDKSTPTTTIPADALRIRVTQHGYEPARVEIPAGKKLTLAFTRDTAPNCGGQVVFPALGIRRPLPPGETVLVELPAQAAGEIGFSCGMGMFRGMMVAR